MNDTAGKASETTYLVGMKFSADRNIYLAGTVRVQTSTTAWMRRRLMSTPMTDNFILTALPALILHRLVQGAYHHFAPLGSCVQ